MIVFRTRQAKRANAAGIAAMHAGEYERAEMLLRYALAIRPDAWALWLNLGNCMGNRGRYREALRHYHHAHTLAPLEHAPVINMAYAHLTLGEYREGWALYEERWRDPAMLRRTSVVGGMTGFTDTATHRKRWDGVPREGQTLLVFPEQGVGDVIQMLRLHGQLVGTGMRIVYRVPLSLYRLVRYNCREAEVTLTTDPLPSHDWHVPFLSLPYHFRVWSPADVDGATYLTAPIDPAIHALPSPKIGVVWRGNPNHPGDARRSMAIEVMAPLFAIPGVTFVSLQIGAGQDDADRYGLHRIRPMDFEDTARILSALDYVVGVDTATIHLAGALGVPAFCMVARAADWRWLLDRTDTPWYHSIQLGRQMIAGDWSGAMREAIRLVPTLCHTQGAA